MSRFPCAGDESVAITGYRLPAWRRALHAVCDYGAVVMIGTAIAFGLVYGWSLPQ